jgi:hypothetical protein
LALVACANVVDYASVFKRFDPMPVDHNGVTLLCSILIEQLKDDLDTSWLSSVGLLESICVFVRRLALARVRIFEDCHKNGVAAEGEPWDNFLT